jgi:arginyl-tRNA--protein-N-Asp/Glu arginylyltransferase
MLIINELHSFLKKGMQYLMLGYHLMQCDKRNILKNSKPNIKLHE